MTSKALLTFDEFEHLAVREDTPLELDEGEIHPMSPGRPRHNRIRDRLARRLTEVVERNGLGEVFVETEFRMGEDTIRVPDVAFVRAEHVRQIDPDLPIAGAPVLAIEVVSPNDLAENLARKVEQYLAAGAEAVWVLYPKMTEVHVCPSRGTSRMLGPEEVLQDDRLFPGFSLRVGDLFS